MEQGITEKAETYIRSLLGEEGSGHDAEHALRVCRTALAIAEKEGADPVTVAVAALLHDADDRKLFPETAEDLTHAKEFLRSCEAEPAFTAQVLDIIRCVSFQGTDSAVPGSAEGKCVQDADRLDAMGAIGIARCFAYGGSRGRKIYDPSDPPAAAMDAQAYRMRSSHSVNHFYEKLLLLKGLMNTAEGKRLAEARHRYLEDFLEEFFAEWKGER